jgi:arylsulfatase A-like enzyme
MEWLFFITKPSYFNILSGLEKLGVLLMTGLVVSIIGLIALATIVFLEIILAYLGFTKFSRMLEILVPALILSAMGLLLLDNFTYVVFKFGIISSSGIWRAAYGLVFLAFLAYFYFKLLTLTGVRDRKSSNDILLNNRVFRYTVLGLVLISSAAAFITVDYSIFAKTDNSEIEKLNNVKRPHILLIGSDGVNANHMSVYGYERDTTPIMAELAQYSLVAENAFTNSGSSTGSVISMFTGKLPAETRVLHSPDILRGSDAYEHLPGILKRNGYKSVEIAMWLYVDAYATNLQNGFDIVNGRSIEEDRLVQYLRNKGFADAAYFVGQISNRITQRLLHVFYIQQMEDVFQAVTQPSQDIVRHDQVRVDDLIDLIANTDQPLFAHVHLLGTHGPTFYPVQRKYSDGKTQNEDWMIDFYDDAILDYDSYVGQIITALDEYGQFDNTLLIIYSDHGQKWGIVDRIPLIIHFPENEYAFRVKSNVQNLDIAPTILDYLGIEQPEWMGGNSIIDGEMDPFRLIFNASARIVTKPNELGMMVLDAERLGPPFFQFGHIVVINCQNWRQLNLQTLKWYFGTVAGHTAQCDPDDLYSPQQLKEFIIEHLSNNGFEVSSLRE